MKLDQVKNCVIHAFHDEAILDDDRGYRSLLQIEKLFRYTPPRALLLRSTEELLEDSMLDKADTSMLNPKSHLCITTSGIRSVENADSSVRRRVQMDLTLRSGRRVSPDAWKEPDILGATSEVKIEELRVLLRQCIAAIEVANLDQEEKAEAAQRVRAAQEAAEAPTPPRRVILEAILPFRNSFLSEIAKKIVDWVFT